MRIGLLIGGLGRGGSERQLSELAIGLAARGHQVEVVAYTGRGALDEYVASRGVPVRVFPAPSRLAKVRSVHSWMRGFKPDVMHGFMKRASAVAVLASLPRRRCAVVASDFSTATYSRGKPVLWAALVAFSLADRVATQTEKNRSSLELLAPWLRHKTVVVRNGVDTTRFQPTARAGRQGPFRFVCASTVYRLKNPVRVVEAVAALRERGAAPFRVDWYGRLGLGGDAHPSEDYRQAFALARQLGLGDIVTFHGETTRIEDAYGQADALLHVSIQDGIPNAVVEGMASALPIVVSRVSDLPLFVTEAHNGFVCDETEPAAIAEGMGRMLAVPETERLEMGRRSRDLAVRWFARERFVDEYERMYRQILDGRLQS